MEGSETPEKKPVSYSRDYTAIEGKEEIVERFKEYYIAKRKEGVTDQKALFREFRSTLHVKEGIWFNPYPKQLQTFLREWEKLLPIFVRNKLTIKDVHQHRINSLANKNIDYTLLETGAMTLHHRLLGEANSLLDESNETDYMGSMSEVDYEKLRIKKKEIATIIGREVMGGVQKHKAIALKKQKETRETVGFLMDLMHKAQTGELSEEQMQLLETGTAT